MTNMGNLKFLSIRPSPPRRVQGHNMSGSSYRQRLRSRTSGSPSSYERMLQLAIATSKQKLLQKKPVGISSLADVTVVLGRGLSPHAIVVTRLSVAVRVCRGKEIPWSKSLFNIFSLNKMSCFKPDQNTHQSRLSVSSGCLASFSTTSENYCNCY